jgi:hypothetical protein
VHAPSHGFRGSVASNYPPSAARASPTASSLGGEAVADGDSLVLVASLLGFTRGGVTGLGLAAGANPSLLLNGTKVLTFLVKLKCIVLHTNVKFCEKLVPRHLRKISMINGNRYCLSLMTLFS